MDCPLCNTSNITEFKGFRDQTYFKCGNCDLIFVHPHCHLSNDEESTRYSFHQNSISDEGYVNFLNQIISPALNYIDEKTQGLDFGCGPNPVLAEILDNRKIKCDVYDPYFFSEINKEKKYDFVFATECFEHFFYPKKELNLILSILAEKGVLCVMTEFYPASINDFINWYYIKDPTHVCFYNEQTFDFICTKYGFEKIFSDSRRVVIMKNKLKYKKES